MAKTGNIYFVGMMGSGKTTIGRYLARRLKKRFIDCDQEIEARTGVRIPVIFEIEGEQGFRRREAQVVKELTAEKGIVLSTGGGVVLDPENRACLAANGLVVYLSVPPDELYQRTRHDKNRPLLQVADPLGKIQELYALRDPLYREIADIVIDGAGKTAFGVARLLEREIRKRCGH
ncbi:MAG: shikimate kinase [Pseudomonadota bacterium]